ncbi:hypothetical protein [Mesonia mobilis]|uniref:hypothetical protein n=1 Tax=Mesonia mobilis TaxID=369791 RepID=UPI000400484F|nr:hypothetical protein [Mesonia mobilis]MBQ0737978.1 hypothetical protein [Aquimarina celericrescens]
MRIKLELFWIFYRKFFLAGLLINVALAFFNLPLAAAILFKFLLVIIITMQGKLKKNFSPLVFYQNLGVSSIQLLLGSFVLELLGLVFIYKLTEVIL